MRMDGAALRPSMDDAQALGWRNAQELRSLRDTISTYRTGASALAARVTELRAEVARLNARLRDDRVARGVIAIEVDLDLDEHTPDVVRAIVLAEFTGVLPPRLLEDVQLVAIELTAGSVRRCTSRLGAAGVLRVECADGYLRIEIERCAVTRETPDSTPGRRPLEDCDVDIVERLSERWGIELASSGRSSVWALLRTVA